MLWFTFKYFTVHIASTEKKTKTTFINERFFCTETICSNPKSLVAPQIEAFFCKNRETFFKKNSRILFLIAQRAILVEWRGVNFRACQYQL